ncbi:hypothetical protein N6G95_09780 [Pediococcus inopinatus]|uniref:hypothetical protein n=1 Tax=Pediococcus inopinatus TaxID=114090 RepID=UPI002B261491|nr:hypothetical protein [Pediococcus inopinatus]WPC19492.1 hypothetical protein N6G95_09780 [Pediococcus inopinatus]
MTVKSTVLKLRDEYRPDLKTVASLERAIGLSNGIVSQWDTSVPSKRTAQKVADFFHVSIERVYGTQSTKEDPDPIALYRINTRGLSKDEIEEVKNQLRFAEELARKQVREKRGDK